MFEPRPMLNLRRPPVRRTADEGASPAHLTFR